VVGHRARKNEAFASGRVAIRDAAQIGVSVASHFVGLDTPIDRVLGIEGVVADDGRLHVFLLPGNDGRLAPELLLRPIEYVEVRRVPDHDGEQLSAFGRQPARQLLFEHRPLVAVHPIALEGRQGALQAGVQAQPVKRSGGDELTLGVPHRMGGMLQMVTIDRPDRPLLQFRELLGNWIFRGIGSGRGLRGGCRVKAESDPCSPPTLESA